MESTAKRSVYEQVLTTIRSEHQSMADVIGLLQHLLRNISDGHLAPDFELLALALYYIDDFAFRCHHPKEDRHLFAVLRQRVPSCASTLNALQAEHQRDEHYVRELHRLVVLYQGGAPNALEQLRNSLDIYAAMLYEHMRKEETLLGTEGAAVPDADWQPAADAFVAESDPLAKGSVARDFTRLRDRITMMLPRKLRM